MQNLTPFEDRIKQVLKASADTIIAAPELGEKIKFELNQSGRLYCMRKSIWKKAMILVAILCIGTVTVFAVGGVDSYVSTTSNPPIFLEYPSDELIEKEMDFSAKTVETFSNGFSFVDANISDTSALDSMGNKVHDFKELSFNYTIADAEDNQKLEIVMTNTTAFEESKEIKTFITYKGIDLYYKEQVYKFVPVEYELTQEDQERADAGELEISCGASNVTEANLQFLSWQEDGISYMIMATDYDLSEEVLYQMAEEIIR